MTQTRVGTSSTERETLVPLTLPEPFLDIARHCLLRHPQERGRFPRLLRDYRAAFGGSSQSVCGRPSRRFAVFKFPYEGSELRYSLAAGIIFAFVAIVAGPRLLHRILRCAAPITSLEEPTVSSERSLK